MRRQGKQMPRDVCCSLAPVLCPEIGCSVLGIEGAVAAHDANHRPQGTRYGPGDYVLGGGPTQQSVYGRLSQGFSFAPNLPRRLTEALLPPGLGCPAPQSVDPGLLLSVRDSWKDYAF